MTDPHDRSIDQTLHALGGTALPDGLQARILARLAQSHPAIQPGDEPAAQPTSLSGRLWLPGKLAFAFACLLLAAVAVRHASELHRHAAAIATSTRPSSTGQPAHAVSPMQNLTLPASIQPASIRPATQPASQPPADAPTVIASTARVPSGGTPDAVPPRQQASSRGLADLPSMLAPAEPITSQERMLARIARVPGPGDFALLNPDTRDLLAQQSAAAFNQAFPPAIPQEIYLAIHVENYLAIHPEN